MIDINCYGYGNEAEPERQNTKLQCIQEERDLGVYIANTFKPGYYYTYIDQNKILKLYNMGSKFQIE